MEKGPWDWLMAHWATPTHCGGGLATPASLFFGQFRKTQFFVKLFLEGPIQIGLLASGLLL
jgi:hypothetical protein